MSQSYSIINDTPQTARINISPP